MPTYHYNPFGQRELIPLSRIHFSTLFYFYHDNPLFQYST